MPLVGSAKLSSSLTDLRDQLGRTIQDVRISVTDRCNFRCVYCMPTHLFGMEHLFLPRHDILTFEEMVRTVRILIPMGLRKVRLTGGEPLLRQDLPALIRALYTIKNHQEKDLDITLTTNGALLEKHLPALIAAGLKRVTISLDALSPKVFSAMNGVDFSVERVLSAISASVSAGLQVKINMVVIRHTNDHELLNLVEYVRKNFPKNTQGLPSVVLRFIEFMDVGNSNAWQWDRVVSAVDMRSIIQTKYPLIRLPSQQCGEVARRYAFEDGLGEIGFITSVSAPFCGECSRLRLSADGKIYTCLFAHQGYDWRERLRSGEDDAVLASSLMHLWQQRADRYSEERTHETKLHSPKVEMSYIGG